MKNLSFLMLLFSFFIVLTGWAEEQLGSETGVAESESDFSLPNAFIAKGVLTIDGGRARETTLIYDSNIGKAAVSFQNSKTKDKKTLIVDTTKNILITKTSANDPVAGFLPSDKKCFQESYKKGLPSIKGVNFDSKNQGVLTHAFGSSIEQINLTLNEENELAEISTSKEGIGKISLKVNSYSQTVPSDTFSRLENENCVSSGDKLFSAPQGVFNTMPGRCLDSADKEISCSDSIFSKDGCGYTSVPCTDDEKGCYCISKVDSLSNYGRFQGLGRYKDGCGAWDWVDCAARYHDRHRCADAKNCKTDCANNCNYKATLLHAYNRINNKNRSAPWDERPVTHNIKASLDAALSAFGNGWMQNAWFWCACDWPTP